MSDFQLALTNTAGISSVASFWAFVASNGTKRWEALMWKAGSVIMAIWLCGLDRCHNYSRH